MYHLRHTIQSRRLDLTLDSLAIHLHASPFASSSAMMTIAPPPMYRSVLHHELSPQPDGPKIGYRGLNLRISENPHNIISSALELGP
mmetsp:Transcript_3605/g.4908  ORF Transcript_3605/g.4908 Transcript_3605/m.4908 type:complete len:87 (-) Transcript_3605:1496-1756(-)